MLSWLHILSLVTLTALPAATDDSCKTFTTLSASLSVDVPNANQRVGRISEALKNSPADVICLQDIWNEKDMDAILKELSEYYPHHYSKLHAAPDHLRRPMSCVDRLTNEYRQKDISCTPYEAAVLSIELDLCAERQRCNSLSGLQRELCVATKCSDVFNRRDVTEDCVSCLFTNYGLSLGTSLHSCTKPQEVDNRLNGPGLLVLSKTRLGNPTYTSFFPDNKVAFQKGYIEANLSDGKKFTCTQLSGLFNIYVEYNLPFSSFKEQNRAQIMQLMSRYRYQDPILMGDLNVGPEVLDEIGTDDNLVGEAPENYQLYLQNGYRSPYMEEDGRCTYCENNPLNTRPPNWNSQNNALSHVMIKATSRYSAPSAERVLDDPLLLLSDRYGVQVQVCDK